METETRELLQVKIYGKLEYVGQSPEGELHFYISKENKRALKEIIQALRMFQDKQVGIFMFPIERGISRGKDNVNE